MHAVPTFLHRRADRAKRRHGSGDKLPVARARMTRRAGRGGAGQGAGVAELLSAFDAVRAEHEGMAAEAFNDDVAYKTGINQVGGGARHWRLRIKAEV